MRGGERRTHLDDRVERHVIQLLDGVHRRHVHGVQRQRVQRVARRLLPLGRHGRVPQQRVLRLALRVHRRVLLQLHLVQRQRARLVRAQDGHAGHVLDRRQPRDDGAVVRQLLGAQRQRGGGDDLDGQRDGGHEQHDGEGQGVNDALVALQQVDEHRDAQRQ